MQIYLPIAELSVNVLLLLGLGGLIGFLSGIFGVGGGFLMTPLLIFIGVPPPVAVATQANNVVASSISGVIGHFRRGNVDVRMGVVLLAGGLVGSTAGVRIFKLLREIGQIDVVINLSYAVMLAVVGILMSWEGASAIIRRRREMPQRSPHFHGWAHRLPLKVRFPRSRLYISALLPLTVGVAIGVLSAIMGVGGGFILVPAMIYLIGMPTSVVIGTSLFQIIFVAANVTFLQAVQNQTVDIVLALLLLLGSVVGAQYGSHMATRVPGDMLRILLGIIVIATCGRLVYELVSVPVDLYTLGGPA
ncbi:hypothetical protein SAMN05216241_10754 [Limimonas halophila]|uniref:Probable membrane transporter protein n=1 Tax=Limimonas halophila TaxID=1082479 RepID=A0A1G7SL77_9PROT|nr:sulfite exporter TauE/SafE family protein [Limimonas halophila]SDG23763.1 hypothetical protein SAMN05216241_10754 [Limimonas halophila]